MTTAVHNTYVNLKKVEITLSNFELCLIRMICCEYTPDEIAASFHIQLGLLESLIGNIISKLGAKNEVGIALFAWENSLV